MKNEKEKDREGERDLRDAQWGRTVQLELFGLRPVGGCRFQGLRVRFVVNVPVRSTARWNVDPEAAPFISKLICPEAGLSVPRRAHLSRGGPIYPKAGLSAHVHPNAGLSVPMRAHLSRGGPLTLEGGCAMCRLSGSGGGNRFSPPES